MAAPIGNNYAAKGRRVEKMIERALEQEDSRRLRQGVEALLDKVAEGERWALEFVRDSLDGKPTQRVEGSGENGEFIQKVLIEFVDANQSTVSS